MEKKEQAHASVVADQVTSAQRNEQLFLANLMKFHEAYVQQKRSSRFHGTQNENRGAILD